MIRRRRIFFTSAGLVMTASRLGRSARGWLRARVIALHTMCLLPPLRGVTGYMIPLGPLPATAGGVQTEIANKTDSLRGNEQSGSGDEVAGIPDLGGVPDGGVEIGAVAHRRLGRQIEKLGQGEGGAGDVRSTAQMAGAGCARSDQLY